MSENPTPSSTAANTEPGLKSLFMKGLVGAVSLAGATAIPLVVQQALNPSPSVESAPKVPAQVAPAQAVPAQEVVQPATSLQEGQQADEQPSKGKSKKKGKSKD